MTASEEIAPEYLTGFFTSLFLEVKWGGPIIHFFIALFGVWIILYTLLTIKRDAFPSWAVIPVIVIPQFLMGGGFVHYALCFKLLTETLGVTGSENGYWVSWLRAHVETHSRSLQCAGLIVFLGLVSNTVTLIGGFLLFRRSVLVPSIGHRSPT